MLEIQKRCLEHGEEFKFFTENGNFEIFFGGNLDLYWNCEEDMEEDIERKSFYITKENFFLFLLFEQLYSDIKDYNIYSKKKLNEFARECDSYCHDLLFQNEKIVWYSDDAEEEEASVLIIEKNEEFYKVTFQKGKEQFFPTYAIRIRNSGSRYQPFQIPFMRMYQQLCEYDPNYRQIHLEEYLFQKKKLSKRKETI